MYLSVVGYNCSIMYNDYELTMDYDMIVCMIQVILVATHQFRLDPHHCFFQFSVSLIAVQFTIFSNFLGLELSEPF